ncbi:MAG TPA: cytochrome c biogenesis protein CcsA [Ignavibacteria bacterium]|nr:cytochrome c biogenesis protein CcsA [Ignavibacteria bacterium]
MAIKIFKYSSIVLVTAVIFLSFLIPIPHIPALGDKARVLYYHVPMSWISVVAFFMSMVYAVKYLRTRDPQYDVKQYSAAELGFVFCILATATGSLWAKFNWGAFWNWDPRQTSIFILLLIYGAYFVLRASLDNYEQKARLSSVYAILAFVTVPFFVFIMPRVVDTLHPDPIVNSRGKIDMDPKMLYIFLTSLVGFTFLFLYMFQLKVKTEILNLKLKNSSN